MRSLPPRLIRALSHIRRGELHGGHPRGDWAILPASIAPNTRAIGPNTHWPTPARTRRWILSPPVVYLLERHYYNNEKGKTRVAYGNFSSLGKDATESRNKKDRCFRFGPLVVVGGGAEIRTLAGCDPAAGFQDQSLQPLGYASSAIDFKIIRLKGVGVIACP